MSQTSMDSEMIPDMVPESAETMHADETHADGAHETSALALSVDEFAALEERVLRAVNLVKRERMARAAAEDHAKQMEARLAEHTSKLTEHTAQLTEHVTHVEQLRTEVKTLRAERDHVRQRVERLLSQLDALEI
jgi:chromosome segregation ATPase